MLEDCSNFSVEEPLVIGEALLQFGANATQTFLKHVYQHHPVSSHEEAQQLLSMAHLLDAPSLMKKAVSYMEDTEHLLQATCEPAGAIYWLLLADRFDLTNFREQCIHFTVQHFHVLQRDDRLAELRTATCLALLRALQAKIDKHEVICPCKESSSQHTPGTATYLYRGLGTSVPFSRPDFRAASGPQSRPDFGARLGPQSIHVGSQSTPAFPAFGGIRHGFGAGPGPQGTHAFGDTRHDFRGFGSPPPFGLSRPQSSTLGG